MSRRKTGFAECQGRFDFTGADISSDCSRLTDADLMRLLLSTTGTKVDASRAVEAFESLWTLVSAPDAALRAAGIPVRAVSLLRLVREASLRVHAAPLKTAPVLSNWVRLLEHLQGRFTGLSHEAFWVLHLDKRNRLIVEECAGEGTIDHCPVYPREVVRRCLELGTAAVILCHNHPSGDPTPSRADIEITKKIIAACQAVDVGVHDHVIVGATTCSMKSAGLI